MGRTKKRKAASGRENGGGDGFEEDKSKNINSSTGEDKVSSRSDNDLPPPSKRLKESAQKSPPVLIAIHLGAGEHSVKRRDAYKALCTKACDQAKLILLRGGSASDAVVAATVILEDSGIVNAGSGSSLTYEKTVECDAGFMNGNGFFGGVGAVPGIRNPILVAKKIADMHEEKPLLSCGRVPPTLLTGEGAKQWAEVNGIPVSENSALISKMASKSFDKYMNMLSIKSSTLPQEVGDTVGAIAIDKDGNVAASVSSGGNWLKQSGRLGHAPLFGCGIWASKTSCEDNPLSIAVSCSGAGEMLSKVQLPQKLTCYVMKKNYLGLVSAAASLIENEFINARILEVHQETKHVGLVALVWDGVRLEVVWGHTSQNFVIAFNGAGVKSTQMSFSSLSATDKVGRSVNVNGIVL